MITIFQVLLVWLLISIGYFYGQLGVKTPPSKWYDMLVGIPALLLVIIVSYIIIGIKKFDNMIEKVFK